jgi:hypothetical protein
MTAEPEPEITTMKVSKTLRDVLRDSGRKNETLESVVWRLIDSPEIRRKQYASKNEKDALENFEREEKKIAAAKHDLPLTDAKIATIHKSLEETKRKRNSTDPDEAVKASLLQSQLMIQLQALMAQRDRLAGLVDREPGLLLKRKRLELVKSLLAQYSDGENLPDCPRCQANDSVRLTQGIDQPRFRTPSAEAGWRNQTATMILTFTCEKCLVRFETVIEETRSTVEPLKAKDWGKTVAEQMRKRHAKE